MKESRIEHDAGSTSNAEPSFQYCAASEGPQLSSAYRELRKSVERAGLLDRQYAYYTRTVLLSWGMLMLGLVFLRIARQHGLYLLDAVYLAFVFGQIGYLGHDGAHGEIFREWGKNHVFCLFHGNLLLGLSTGWWSRKHNLHHSNPNCITLDGELEIAGLAFTEEEALNRQGFMRVLARYQAFTFFPLLALTALGLRVGSAQFLARAKPRHFLGEAILCCLHFALYGWLVFASLGALRGIMFVIVHQVLFGLYMGSVFAPNHKGMPMLKRGAEVDFLHKQVITARNINPGRIADYWYGGLNYQIEHHLFPSMPRNRLREARQIVKAFCAAHDIPYVETGVFQSYVEILRYLHGVSRGLRDTTTPIGNTLV